MEENNLPVIFNHNDYDKLIDELVYLDKNYVLKFNVILGSQNQDGTKKYYHQEYRYNSSKYIDKKAQITLKRNFSYYLSIESRYNDGFNKDFIMIRACDMILVNMQLNRVMLWFSSEEFKDLYVLKDGLLTVQGRPQPVRIDGLAQNKYLIFSPIVMEYNGCLCEGVRMVLPNSNFIDLTLDKFCELAYLLHGFNMYMAASCLLAYFSHPPLGQNVYSFGQAMETQLNNTPALPDMSSGKNGRQVKKKSLLE